MFFLSPKMKAGCHILVISFATLHAASCSMSPFAMLSAMVQRTGIHVYDKRSNFKECLQ